MKRNLKDYGHLMTSFTRLSLTAFVFLAPAVAQPPKLIDRELFFGDPEIAGAQISPDGKYIAFLKPLYKTRNIWVKKTEEPFSAAKPITNETKRPIAGVSLEPRRQVHPLRAGQAGRRELQCLRGGSGGGAGGRRGSTHRRAI